MPVVSEVTSAVGHVPCLSRLCCAACRTDGALAKLKIKSVGDLAKWKYASWADALVTLAEYEREDMSSR